MKIEADWLTARSAQKLLEVLQDGEHRTYFVGGCVRNSLLQVPVTDVDIATSLPPEQVMDLANAAGFKAIPTGIEHGTVTLVVQGETYEVTTFRRDVETDGRRAVVAFANTIEDDAARRDFTMNALYVDAEGAVFDPTGQGLTDIAARTVRFIGAPIDRIREDYLRILRYFRFYAWFGDQAAGFDADTLADIAEGIDGLEQISNERIGAEVLKLLAAPDPSFALATMSITGILARILPGAFAESVPIVVAAEETLGLAPDPLRRLAALGGENAPEALRMAKADARKVDLIRAAASEGIGIPELGYRLGHRDAMSTVAVRSALFQEPVAVDAKDQVKKGSGRTFPVTAADLMADYNGPALGNRLRTLEKMWIASDFTLDRDSLLAAPQNPS